LTFEQLTEGLMGGSFDRAWIDCNDITVKNVKAFGGQPKVKAEIRHPSVGAALRRFTLPQ
jgi:hypothetical protein